MSEKIILGVSKDSSEGLREMGVQMGRRLIQLGKGSLLVPYSSSCSQQWGWQPTYTEGTLCHPSPSVQADGSGSCRVGCSFLEDSSLGPFAPILSSCPEGRWDGWLSSCLHATRRKKAKRATQTSALKCLSCQLNATHCLLLDSLCEEKAIWGIRQKS